MDTTSSSTTGRSTTILLFRERKKKSPYWEERTMLSKLKNILANISHRSLDTSLIKIWEIQKEKYFLKCASQNEIVFQKHRLGIQMFWTFSCLKIGLSVSKIAWTSLILKWATFWQMIWHTRVHDYDIEHPQQSSFQSKLYIPSTINIWKKVLTKAIWADKKWAGFWQISLYIK